MHRALGFTDSKKNFQLNIELENGSEGGQWYTNQNEFKSEFEVTTPTSKIGLGISNLVVCFISNLYK